MISGLGGILAVISLVLVSLPLVIGGVFVILVVSNRADPDPTGRRPAVVYSYAISFIALFLTLFATFAVVVNLVSLIGSHHSTTESFSSFGSLSGSVSTSGSQHPIGDAAARGIVIGLLLALVAGAAYLIHVRTADRATEGLAPVEPPGRVRSSYIAAVSFVCVTIVIITLVVAAYQVFRIIAPGIFNSGGDGSRVAALRTMLPLVYLALASAWLLRRHLWQVPPESRPMFGWPPGGRPDPAADTVADTTPLAVEVEVLEVAPTAVRKRAPAKRTTTRRPPPPTT